MNDQPLPARRVAADVLNQVDPTRQVVHAILAKNLDRTDQRQRCTDLVLGVVRNCRAIDVVIERFGRRPVARIARPLVSVIRLAVFELVYCPRAAVHAIVHEAVEVVKGAAGPRQVGFVNAVLRQITAHLSDRQGLLGQVDPRQVLPTDPQQGCAFDEPFLPDPKVEAADYLSSCFSLPQGLVAGWIGQFGYEQTWQIGLASKAGSLPPPQSAQDHGGRPRGDPPAGRY